MASQETGHKHGTGTRLWDSIAGRPQSKSQTQQQCPRRRAGCCCRRGIAICSSLSSNNSSLAPLPRKVLQTPAIFRPLCVTRNRLDIKADGPRHPKQFIIDQHHLHTKRRLPHRRPPRPPRPNRSPPQPLRSQLAHHAANWHHQAG